MIDDMRELEALEDGMAVCDVLHRHAAKRSEYERIAHISAFRRDLQATWQERNAERSQRLGQRRTGRTTLQQAA